MKPINKKFETSLVAYRAHVLNDYLNRAGRFDTETAKIVKAQMDAHFELGLIFKKGRQYVKLVMGNGSGSSVHSFIAMGDDKFAEGTVLKAASWATPARNFGRGSIYDAKSLSVNVRWMGVV